MCRWNAKAKVPTLRFIAVSLANAKQIHFGWAAICLATAMAYETKWACECVVLFVRLELCDYFEHSHWRCLQHLELCTCSQHTCRDRWRAAVLLFFITYTRFVCVINKQLRDYKFFFSVSPVFCFIFFYFASIIQQFCGCFFLLSLFRINDIVLFIPFALVANSFFFSSLVDFFLRLFLLLLISFSIDYAAHLG